MSEKDTQTDMIFDFRDFYQTGTNLDDDDEEERKQNDNDRYYQNQRGKKGVKGQGQTGYKKVVYMAKEEVTFENIKLIKYRALRNM